MNNFAVARVFTRIGDLMEIKGENPFKIRAYRQAASTMQELTESLEVVAESGELLTIPGVGEAIAAKTRDILSTGTTKLYEKLKEEVPESLTELLPLSGFGPKKIQAVWKNLGIRNLDDLEQAAREHRLQSMGGFSVKSELNLLSAIEALRKRRERRPVFEALPYAEALVRMLLQTGHFTRLEIAGSIRRGRDMVADVDLAGATADAAATLEAISVHPEAAEVLERSEQGISFVTHDGVRVDLYVAPEPLFAWALHQATGSPEHMEQLHAIARSHGVLPETSGDVAETLEATDEVGVYRALGLPYIEPELREGRGEIEAGREGRLPKLIQGTDLRGILHAHTTWSDGSATIEQMAQAARDQGFAYHAITDHSHALVMIGGLDEAKLREQRVEIDQVNAGFTDGFRLLKGIEVDILADGTLDLALDALNELDVVVASVHSHQRQDRETITERVIKALETGVVDILAHPTGRILGVRDPSAIDLDRVFDCARANQVAVEINSFPDRQDLSGENARRARDKGLLLSINTDAHRPYQLQPSWTRWGITQARRAWLEPEQVINTWELDRLRSWLHHRA